ncbi:hypothetical protein E4U09_000169 [Claviceps aff. purpurea]|uniref:Uncharacterized protein n=1 Tax=Claviceps aff. purpurea TaxID=1967640 RepID=A0A9P7QL38_9HYPO|nr:hypothetical protein E4U09_000169 [Claviceps aff. purpurea]
MAEAPDGGDQQHLPDVLYCMTPPGTGRKTSFIWHMQTNIAHDDARARLQNRGSMEIWEGASERMNLSDWDTQKRKE